MEAAYRDDHGDPGVAQRFSTHIGIARDALEEIERIPQRIDEWKNGDGIDQRVMDALVHQYAQRWESVWDQLQSARTIVVGRHRDVSEFDAARAAAGDIYLPATAKAVSVAGSVHVTWKNASTKPAYDAIEALMRAMPEVVVTQQPAVHADLTPSSLKTVLIAGALCLVAVTIWFLIQVFTKTP